jgi:hypothetical protein
MNQNIMVNNNLSISGDWLNGKKHGIGKCLY